MKFLDATLFLLGFGLAFGATVTPTNSESNALVRHKRQIDMLENTRKLIEELVTNLRAAAQQAIDAVANFSNGIGNQITAFKTKIETDIANLTGQINQTIKGVTDRFQLSGEAVIECVGSHNEEAGNIMSGTVSKALDCAGERIDSIGQLIDELSNKSQNAFETADNALSDMKNCTDGSNGLLSTAGCLSSIALQTEIKGASFLASSGMLIARISMAVETLPLSLEFCASARLVEAGINTARITMEIAACSAKSLYSVLSGGNTNSILKLL